jgi:putative SOS response-associated peptidase YedK
MLLAGLYDSTVLEGESQPLWTFSIVTTVANKEFEWLHERQPVILSSQAAIDTWLDVSSQTWSDALTKLVEPYHDSTSPLEWCVSLVRTDHWRAQVSLAIKSLKKLGESGPNRKLS